MLISIACFKEIKTLTTEGCDSLQEHAENLSKREVILGYFTYEYVHMYIDLTISYCGIITITT